MMIMSPKAFREQTHLPQSFLLIPEQIKVKYIRRPDPVAQYCRALLPEKMTQDFRLGAALIVSGEGVCQLLLRGQ
jgi:hypothetical protein